MSDTFKTTSEITSDIDIKSDSSTDASVELNTEIDKSLISLPLEEAEQQLIAKIIEAPTREDLQRQFDLFNINQSKKNALRIIKLSNLLSKVEDQAIERFEKRPDQVSHKELLEYMNVVSGQIDRAHKQVDTLSAAPTINVLTQKNEVNINMAGPELDRDSKERVMDAISALLKQVQTATANTAEIVDPIDIVDSPNLIEVEEFSEENNRAADASDTEE